MSGAIEDIAKRWLAEPAYTKVVVSSLILKLIILSILKKVAATALRQANNSLGQAVQLLQEQPDLIQVGKVQRNVCTRNFQVNPGSRN